MKKVFAAILLFASTTAMAGLYLPNVVDVDLVGQRASGSMWSARYADNSDSFIECGSSGTAGVGLTVFCSAQDAAGDLVFCDVLDLSLIEVVKSISPFSSIQFQWVDGGTGPNICTTVTIRTSSYDIRRLPNN